jgi:fucose 4-O-acetylase-like acetyltransferase
MPTPTIWKQVSKRLKPKKKILWIGAFCGLCLLCIPVVLLIPGKVKDFPVVIVTLGATILFGSWGLILVENWFSDEPSILNFRRLETIFPKCYRAMGFIFEWYASIFLVIWFVVVGVVIVVVLAKI